MATAISVPVIWAIGASLFAVVLTIVIIVFYYLRKRHKASRATVDRTSSQRRAHMSITDEDISRMPGMRRLRPTPYNHPPGWAPISSRESVAKKAWTPNPADIDPVTGLPPWPVRIPRRLKKSQSSPVVRMPPAALSPITERSTNNTATSPSLSTVTHLDHSVKDRPTMNTKVEVYRPSGRPPSLDSPGLLRPKPLFHGWQRSSSHGNLATSTFDPRVKGASAEGVELQNLEVAQMPRSSSLCSQHPGQAPDVPVPPLPIELPASREGQSRIDLSPQRVSGISLLSGDTSVLGGSASRAFSHAETDFTSISLTTPIGPHSPVGLGISTGNVNPKWNFSRVDRSASPLSASKARKVRPEISQRHSFRASMHNSLPRSASSGLSMSLLDRVSPNPKATLHPPNPALKVSPARRQSRVPQPSVLLGLNVFQLNDDKKSKRASTSVLQAVSGNQSSPIKNSWMDRPSSIATEDPFRWDPKTSMQPGKPSAMKNPAQKHKRRSTVRISNIPVIIPSSNPYRFSASSRGQPSISPLTSPLSHLSATNSNQNSIFKPSARPSSTTSSLRPPSLLTFNPQLPKGMRASYSPTASSTTTKPSVQPTEGDTSPYSPTFSMIPLYAPPSPTLSSPSPSSSIASTPTRKRSVSQRHPRQSANHPNRRRAIFPHGAGWPPLLSSSITPQDPPTDPTPSPAIRGSQSAFFDGSTAIKGPQQTEKENWNTSRPPSFLFQFPSPPLTTTNFSASSAYNTIQHPPPRHPAHTIRLPSRSPSPIRAYGGKSKSPTRHGTSPTRHSQTSPTRLPLPSTLLGPRPLPPPSRNRILKHSPRNSFRRSTSPAKTDLLRRSILELRRMNSEVSSSHSFKGERVGREKGKRGEEGGHRRYLSLGDEDEIFEGVKGVGTNGAGVGEEGGGEGGDRVGKEGGRGKGENGNEGRVQGPRELGSCTPTNRGAKRGSLLAKGVGMGTPGSLYDGAGFLRDRGSGDGRGVAV